MGDWFNAAQAQYDHAEHWLPTPRIPGYEVSNFGNVRSVDRRVAFRDGRVRFYKGQPIKTKRARSTHAYRTVNLSVADCTVTRQIHRLVAEAFLGPPEPEQVARHLNGNPANNHVSNLAWGTDSDNMLDAVEHGTHVNARKDACPRLHLLLRPNLIEGQFIRGRRDCRSCALARAHCARNPAADFAAIADQYYVRIMAGQTSTKEGGYLDGNNKRGSHCKRKHAFVVQAGRNVCVACKRAQHYVRANPGSDLKAMADRFYAEMMCL